MNFSFMPNGDWFIFDDEGVTIAKGFESKAAAVSYAKEWL